MKKPTHLDGTSSTITLDAMNFGLPAHPDPHIPRMSFGIGHIISGKYRVEHVLGEGGMGIVVAARHLELDELYAIKIMKREAVGSDAHAERRFIAEARAAARLKGVHVAHVHDIGRLHTGELYMVMEYLRGVDLKRLVRTYGPLPVDLAVTYLLQACEAIAEAHALGIIHRDIKPNNLFVIEDENSIKVLDFGVSKQPVMHSTECTGTNVILGTLPYMAPEQMLKSKNVDARGDIWSLGVVLYELVTGRVPFLGDGILEVFSRISSERPTPPSSVLPSVPGAIDAVIEHCLQVEPARRYQSVQELAFALHALRAEHDTVAAQLAAQAAPPTWNVESPGGPVSDATTTQPRTRTMVAPADPRNQPSPYPCGEPQHRVDVPFAPASAPAGQAAAGAQATHRTWKWPIACTAVAVLLAAAIGGWLSWQAPPPSPAVVPGDPRPHPPGPPRSSDPSAAAAGSAPRSTEQAPAIPSTGSTRPPEVLRIPDTPSVLQRPDTQPDLSHAEAPVPPSPPAGRKPADTIRAPAVPRGGRPNTRVSTATPPDAPSPPPPNIAPDDGALGSASGVPNAEPAGPTRTKYCEATQGDAYPIEVQLTGRTKQQRQKLIDSDSCRGSVASTRLCCRSANPEDSPTATPP